MSKAFNSAVVVIPPNNVWPPIQAIRRELDRNFNRWMPHITLIFPFRPKNEFNYLQNLFQTVCNNYDVFQIELTNFEYFPHSRQKYTIWLNPEPNLPLKNLQKAISSLVPENNDVNKFKGGFRPHLSVGQIKGKSALINTLNLLQNSWKASSFAVKEIYFIWRENVNNSKFRIERTISLKTPAKVS